jgi:hypothetical protein
MYPYVIPSEFKSSFSKNHMQAIAGPLSGFPRYDIYGSLIGNKTFDTAGLLAGTVYAGVQLSGIMIQAKFSGQTKPGPPHQFVTLSLTNADYIKASRSSGKIIQLNRQVAAHFMPFFRVLEDNRIQNH